MALKTKGNIQGDFHSKFCDTLACSTAAAVAAGQAVYLSSNKWTNSGAGGVIDGIVVKGAVAGAIPVVEYVFPGTLIEADLEGSLSASLDPGVKTAALVADGDNVDATAVTGGHLRVLEVDSVNSKIKVVPTKTFLSDTST